MTIRPADFHRVRLDASLLYRRREHAAMLARQEAKMKAYQYLSGERPTYHVVIVPRRDA